MTTGYDYFHIFVKKISVFISSSFLFRDKIDENIKTWDKLKKHAKRDTNADIKARADFLKKNKKVFWIGKPDCKTILKKRLDKERLQSDIQFLRKCYVAL